MNQASLDNGHAYSIFSSDYQKDPLKDERKAHLQVEHNVGLGQLHINFTFDQRGQIEEESIEYFVLKRVELENI